MPFGQLIIGPPGSGKTTYCLGVSEFLRRAGRDVAVINLDPANDALPYECAIDIADLVSLDEVQKHLELGPNGGLIYCMDHLAKNLDWLKERLDPLFKSGAYLLFDCPGQAELFSCQGSFQKVVAELTGRWHVSLASVQLMDSHLCTTPNKLLSALLMCLSSMLFLELPHVNVITKVDLLDRLELDLPITLASAVDVAELQACIERDSGSGAFQSRFARLTEGLCEVVDDFGILSLYPLAIQDAKSVATVVDMVDRANGFAFSGLKGRCPYVEAPGADAGAALPDTVIWTSLDMPKVPAKPR